MKQDVASALCRLSAMSEIAEPLESQAAELVDALFWLVLEDMLGLTKSVLLRVSDTVG